MIITIMCKYIILFCHDYNPPKQLAYYTMPSNYTLLINIKLQVRDMPGALFPTQAPFGSLYNVHYSAGGDKEHMRDFLLPYGASYDAVF